MDPISNLTAVGSEIEVKAMLSRLFDYLKRMGITTLSTSLTHMGSETQERTESEISSLIDTWILLRDIEINGERNRGLYILKSRGMPHSNQIRELVLSGRGIDLLDVYLGPGGVLTGSARAAQEAQEKAELSETNIEARRRMREAERWRKVLEAKIEALRAEYDSETDEMQIISENDKLRREEKKRGRAEMARLRKADLPSGPVKEFKRETKGRGNEKYSGEEK